MPSTSRITRISDFWTGDQRTTGYYKLITVIDRYGSIVNFVVTPATYFVDYEMLSVGEVVIGFYDANAPIPFIYPPQYEAVVKASSDSIIPDR